MLDRNPKTRLTAHKVLCESIQHILYYASNQHDFCEYLHNFGKGVQTCSTCCVVSVSGHPWIVDDNLAPDKPLDSAVLSRLKQFSAMNKLKKMALRVRL